MAEPTSALIGYIDSRLATMERAPGTWGSSESLDLQALLLLELRTFMLRRRTYEIDPYEARDAYIGYVRRRFPEAPAGFLSALLPASELPSALAELHQEVTSTLGAEDPFERAALVLEIRFQRGQGAPFASACRYFCRFERALRAAARSSGRKDVARVLRLPSPELQLPEAEPTRIQMVLGGLGVEAGPLEDGAVASVQEVLDLLARVAGEIGGGGVTVIPPRGRPRDDLLRCVERLIPRAPIASVRVGGTIVGRAALQVTSGYPRAGTEQGSERFLLRVAETTSPYGQEAGAAESTKPPRRGRGRKVRR